MKALFLLGLPDNGLVSVTGYSPAGDIAYMADGNAVFHSQLPFAPDDRQLAFIVWHNEPTRQFRRPDIVINNLNDADIVGNSLKVAADMVDSLARRWPGIAVFNHPGRIHGTTRDAIYRDFHTLPGLHIPKVARIVPRSVGEVFQAAAAAGIPLPFLVRRCGAHGAQKLVRVDSAADAAELEIHAFDGAGFYVTSFVDYRDTDGFYRKARLAMIGGELLPRHFLTGDSWAVTDMSAAFADRHPEAVAAEKRFITDWQAMIAPHALQSLRTVYDRVGLDYLGFDFAVRPDGELLIFEINAAQNVFLPVDATAFPYMRDVHEALVAALGRAVADKVARARA